MKALGSCRLIACLWQTCCCHASGGLTTIVRHGETGFLVSRNPDSFAEQLDILLHDPTLYTQMCAAARPSVLQFGWHKVAHRIQHIYEDFLMRLGS